MKQEFLKLVKDTIKELKSNRPYVAAQVQKIMDAYHEAKAMYDATNFMDRIALESLKSRCGRDIDNVFESWDNSSTFHIIYKDGSECIANGEEILNGDITPKFTNIAYAHYMSGDEEYDTDIGNFAWDVTDDSEFEKREAYLDSVEIKYGTAWGKKHA